MRKSSCLLCGSSLVYQVEPLTFTCEICKGQFSSDAVCRQGHYICDSCHSASAEQLIETFCINSTSTRPVDLAVTLMNLLSVPMHGPVNQYLVPAVLLTAYYNQLGDVEEKGRKLRTARQRAAHVIGDFCGFYGVCVTGIGTGIFVSLIADSSPAAEGAWGLANQMTNESLRSIDALGNMRCCKRDTLMAIKTADGFVQDHFQIKLDVPDTVTCEFSFYNQDCLREKCPFRPLEK